VNKSKEEADKCGLPAIVLTPDKTESDWQKMSKGPHDRVTVCTMVVTADGSVDVLSENEVESDELVRVANWVAVGVGVQAAIM
jgi:hypothetical protein